MKSAIPPLLLLAACVEAPLIEEASCRAEPSTADIIVQLAYVRMDPPDAEGMCLVLGDVVESHAGPVPVGSLFSSRARCVDLDGTQTVYPRTVFDGADFVELQARFAGGLWEDGADRTGLVTIPAPTAEPVITGLVICT